MKKYMYFICLLFCCFLMIDTSMAAAKESQSYIRVGLLKAQDSVEITANNDFVVKDVDNDQNYKFKRMEDVKISQKDKTVYVNKKGKQTTTLIVAVKENAPVIVNGKRYRGNLIIQPHRAGLTVINRLPMDEYLYGVLPEEMPANWNMEALKAQAVAARSFALYYKQDRKHAREGYDVCATTDCQVYGGMDSEATTTNNAVKATSGQVLVYANEPICAVFHAASGGSTENSIDVWGVNVPYLRAVDDQDENSPYKDWIVQMSNEDFSRLIKKHYKDIGLIKEIDMSKIMQKNPPSNKKSTIKFIGSNKGSVELTRAEIRDLLNFKSSNFVIQTNMDNKKSKNSNVLKLDKDDKNLVFLGQGLGHRLGMSQWGAKALADKGQNYKQILYHYYSGVNLQTMY